MTRLVIGVTGRLAQGIRDGSRPAGGIVLVVRGLAERVGPSRFPTAHAYDDASWVGYRLAEVLPLPLSIKQGMLEINDSDVRLALLQKFLQEHGVV